MRNTLLIAISIFIALTFTSSSCKKKKDKWKLPTDVSFRIDINRSAGSGGNLVFTGGSMTFASFSFDGDREQADDVYFTNSYPDGLPVSFDAGIAIPELEFDIPQGTFTKIRVSFQLSGESEEDYLMVSGAYKNSVSGISNPIIIEFEAEEVYDLIARDASGSNQIILDESVPATAVIILDPIYWFQLVSTSALDNAVLEDVDGVATILITEEHNGNIYDLVSDRVDDATEVIFD